MKIHSYSLYCDDCGYIVIKAKRVKIHLNLNNDQYEFKAKCPKCKQLIYNSRNRR